MSTVAAKKQVVALCIANDPVMTRNVISNLVQAAGQTVTLLEKQIGKYHEYESEERVWQEFIQEISDEWVAARTHLDHMKSAFEIYDEPAHQPLGAVGSALEAPFIDEARANYEVALHKFKMVDKKLRKCDRTLDQYSKVSREFNSAQTRKKYIKKLHNALGMLEGSMDLSRIAFEDTLSIQLPAIDEGTPPSFDDLEQFTATLDELISYIPPQVDLVDAPAPTFADRVMNIFKSFS